MNRATAAKRTQAATEARHVKCLLCAKPIPFGPRVLISDVDAGTSDHNRSKRLGSLHDECWARLARAIQRDKARRAAS